MSNIVVDSRMEFTLHSLILSMALVFSFVYLIFIEHLICARQSASYQMQWV